MFTVANLDVPRLADEEVLIKVHAAGINFADWMQRAAIYPRLVPTPYVPGYEVAGVVVATGKAATTLAEGTRVIAMLPMGGGFAEYAVASQRSIVPLPDAISFAAGTALLAQGLTAFILVDKFVAAKRRVLITAAAGGVGSLALQLARLKGATVYGAVGGAEKMELVQEMGGVAIDYSHTNWPDTLLTDDERFDVVLDAVGGAVLHAAWSLLKEGGTLVSYGNASRTDLHLSVQRLLELDFTNQALHFFAFSRHLESDPTLMPRAMKSLFENALLGKLTLPIGQVYPLSSAEQALHDLVARKTTGKVVLVPDTLMAG